MGDVEAALPEPVDGAALADAHVRGRRYAIAVLACQALVLLLCMGSLPLATDTLVALLVALAVRGLACGLWRWPRVFRFLAPLPLVYMATTQVSIVLDARLLSSSVYSYFAHVEGLTGLCLIGLLWFSPHRFTRRVSLCVGGVATVGLLVLALADKGEQARHHDRLARMAAHLGPIVADGTTRPIIPCPKVPAGAVDFDAAWWSTADADAEGKAEIMSHELGRRLYPCQAARPDLTRWRANERRSGRELTNLVVRALRQCDRVGIDIDALEHLILLPWLVPPAPNTK